MRVTAIGVMASLLAAAAIGLVPAGSQAQTHARGACWIHRDAAQSTWLHAMSDSLCFVQFPSACYGGMMMPESLYCDFRTVPPESMPRGCAAAYQMHVRDPQGGCMMGGRMSFRRDLSLTLHYDPQAVAALAIAPANLVLIRHGSTGYEIVDAAVHDTEAAVFHWTTTVPNDWYGVADRTNLPLGVAQETWSAVKASYR